MKNFRFYIILMFLLIMSVTLTGIEVMGQNVPPLKVVATTSLIGSIVQQVGRERVEVVIVIPGFVCPGHFDLKAQEARMVAQAKFILRHGWEGETLLSLLIESAGNPDLMVISVPVKGNWMVPDTHCQAVKAITSILVSADLDYEGVYQTRAQEFINSIQEKSRWWKEKITSRVEGRPVICSEMQKEFLEWLGFRIVVTYDRPEDLTPREVGELIRKGREERVLMVIDNLQSGPTAGKVIAAEIPASHVVLSNFPGGFPDTDTYLTALEKNFILVLEALARE